MATTSISTILPRATLKLFSDFGGAARPGRQDGAGETASFTPIVDTRCLDLELAGSRRHRPRLSHAVAHHKGVAGLVAMVDVLGDVLIDFSFERCQQHASHTLAHQLIQIELERIVLSLIRSHYAQHAAYLSMDGLTVARLQQPGAYAALLPRPRSTAFGYTSFWRSSAPKVPSSTMKMWSACPR